MLTLELAEKVSQKALNLANEKQQKICVVVVNTSGDIILAKKMDGAFSVSDIFAKTKAVTSATLGMNSGDMAPYAEPGKPYHGLLEINGGKFTTIAGGAPIKSADGQIIGGIGVGGSYDVAIDQEIANKSLISLVD